MIGQFSISKIHKRIGKQQHAGLWHRIVAIADFPVCKQAAKLSARREAYQRIVFRLDLELVCIFRDQLHRPAQILQRCIVAGSQKGAVSQHKHGVTHFMQLVRCRAALLHLRGDAVSISRHYKCILSTRRAGWIIEQLCSAQRRIRLDLLRRIDLPCDLHAVVIVFDYQIHCLGTVFHQFRLCILCQRLVLPIQAFNGQHFPAVSIVARTLDGRIFP